MGCGPGAAVITFGVLGIVASAIGFIGMGLIAAFALVLWQCWAGTIAGIIASILGILGTSFTCCCRSPKRSVCTLTSAFIFQCLTMLFQVPIAGTYCDSDTGICYTEVSLFMGWPQYAAIVGIVFFLLAMVFACGQNKPHGGGHDKDFSNVQMASHT